MSTLELASNNLVCSVALTGVLALQAGRWWAERADPEDDEMDAVAEAAAEDAKQKRKRERAAAGSEKKSPKKLSKRKAQA